MLELFLSLSVAVNIGLLLWCLHQMEKMCKNNDGLILLECHIYDLDMEIQMLKNTSSQKDILISNMMEQINALSVELDEFYESNSGIAGG